MPISGQLLGHCFPEAGDPILVGVQIEYLRQLSGEGQWHSL